MLLHKNKILQREVPINPITSSQALKNKINLQENHKEKLKIQVWKRVHQNREKNLFQNLEEEVKELKKPQNLEVEVKEVKKPQNLEVEVKEVKKLQNLEVEVKGVKKPQNLVEAKEARKHLNQWIEKIQMAKKVLEKRVLLNKERNLFPNQWKAMVAIKNLNLQEEKVQVAKKVLEKEMHLNKEKKVAQNLVEAEEIKHPNLNLWKENQQMQLKKFKEKVQERKVPAKSLNQEKEVQASLLVKNLNL